MVRKNVFEKHPDIGKDLLNKLLEDKITLAEASRTFRSYGIKATAENLGYIVKKEKKILQRKGGFSALPSIIVAEEDHMSNYDARITLEEIKAKLIGKHRDGSNIIKVDPVAIINNAILDLEKFKASWGYGDNYYLAGMKMQTDIALKLFQMAPTVEKTDINELLESFDWVTQFIMLLDKEQPNLDIKRRYTNYLAERQAEVL